MVSTPERRGAALRLAMTVAGVAIAVILAAAVLAGERSHRRAAERALRDFAGIAGTEFVRRTAFDVGFNGYQVVGNALYRTAAAGEIALPPRLPPAARALVRHLYLVEGSEPRRVAGGDPPPWLEGWIRAEAAALPRDRDPFLARQRTIDGAAETLVLVPLDDAAARLAAFDVDLDALRPYLQHSLDRGPLLPEVVGDGHITNGDMTVVFRDPAGGERLRAGAGRWPEWEIEVPFGDFYRSVLAGCHVTVAIDPGVADRLLRGGLPRSQLVPVAALVAAALALALLAALQLRRERAFARLREDFVVGVSHELRTPLAQIRLFTETVLLGRCRSPDEQRRFLEAAAREAVRMGHLIDNILDFSRSERGVLDLDPAPRRLAPLVEEVTHAFAPLAAGRRVALESDLDPDASAAVDEGGFRRVLLNLLDNAIKYGPESSAV